MMHGKERFLIIRYLLLPLFALSGHLMLPPGLTTSHSHELTLEKLLQGDPTQARLLESFGALVEGPASPGPLIGREVVIAAIYPELQKSRYWTDNLYALAARLEERGVRHRLLRYPSRPQEVDLQLAQLQEALTQDPDYLLFHLDSPRHVHAAEWLLSRQRPAVLLQNVTSLPLDWRDGPRPLLSTGFDHQIGTGMLARQILSFFPEDKVHYAVLTPKPGYLSLVRGDYFVGVARSLGYSGPVDRYYLRTDAEQARKAALELVRRHPDLSFIYAATTDLALGASQALVELGRCGDVMVNGWGGGESELAAILDGRLDMTVMRMNDDAGVAQAEAIWLDLTGRRDQVPLLWSGRFHLVDRYTSTQEIEHLRSRAFRYSRDLPASFLNEAESTPLIAVEEGSQPQPEAISGSGSRPGKEQP